MIKTVECNLLENTDIDAIAHQCNCQNVMGSGVALALKNKWEEVYVADIFYHASQDGKILGKLSLAAIGEYDGNVRFVFNLYGQDSFGIKYRSTNYEALYTALEMCRKTATSYDIKNLGIPYRMGSDRGGGDWRIVNQMIECVFENAPFNVTICKLPKT